VDVSTVHGGRPMSAVMTAHTTALRVSIRRLPRRCPHIAPGNWNNVYVQTNAELTSARSASVSSSSVRSAGSTTERLLRKTYERKPRRLTMPRIFHRTGIPMTGADERRDTLVLFMVTTSLLLP
jgi:hypothetical protein